MQIHVENKREHSRERTLGRVRHVNELEIGGKNVEVKWNSQTTGKIKFNQELWKLIEFNKEEFPILPQTLYR